MADLEKIKKEIIEDIKKNNKDIPNEIKRKIKNELDIFEQTESLSKKSNLEVFYNSWISWKKDNKEATNLNKINSWTAYYLKITTKKPDGDFLQDRRYFARVSFPDIDTDFDDEGRDKIYEYIINKYGRDNVGNIGTHGKLKFKSCLRRVGKALDIANSWGESKEDKQAYITNNEARVSEIINTFPEGSVIKVKDESGDVKIIDNVDDALTYCPDFRREISKHEGMADYVREIQGTFATFSSHAAGICVSDIPIGYIAPLRRAKKDCYSTQYPNEDLESLGLIKFDILAISTLTVIKNTCKLIKENYDIDLDYKNLSLDDKKTLDIYRNGNLGGVFQCEQWGMQQTMKDIEVDSFKDVMAAIALYRPGPMDNIPEYCARKKGIQELDYFHKTIEPFVKEYLKETYAVLVYQEQLMQICSSLANFSIAEGYMMIKAIGKKIPELMASFEKQFIKGCVDNKVPQGVAKQYWDKFIVPFANYGFNKCLDGKMRVKDKKTKKFYYLEDLSNEFLNDNKPNIILDSYKDGKIVEDELIDVFETGEKDIYEIELENGMIIKSTLDHKFMCSDNKIHTIEDIFKNDLEIISFQILSKKCKIKLIKKIGKKKTYNLTMKSDQHNYMVYGENSSIGVISRNSHAGAYGYLSYQTAYLKANYPEEFIITLLNTEVERAHYEKAEKFEKEFSKKMNVKFLPRTLNDCGVRYRIEQSKDVSKNNNQTLIRPSLLCKSVGMNAAKEIEKNAPYKDLRDLAERTGFSVTTEVIGGLIEAGFFKGKKGIRQKDKIVYDFKIIRDDLKKANKKGIESVDIFG